ncbi:MAG: response regulator transcription factor [Clostridia bacterium]|nr:response regulator transcription factor [Clostridia bacterium]MBP3559666.1 response regulator transcription factor [Clostridia bacterium]
MRILLAEDEKALSRVLVKLFEKNSCSVDAVYNGTDALEYLKAGNYDVAVLDIMMPKMDGISVLKQIRANGNNIPVLILTAKSETDDKVLGLDSGANYYLTKPFDSKELLAAIRAITRTKTEVDSVISFGNINLNRATFELSGPNGSLKLTNKEFQIIEILITNPNHIISTEKFMEKIWGFDTEADISVVWVYISYLRKKLTALDADLLIKASRNAGYSLEKKV